MAVTIDGTSGITSPAIDITTPLTVSDGGTGLSSVGTAGNVLTSNGTAWTSAAPTTNYIDTQTFTASGTWTKPASGTYAIVRCWGGGGSGGKGTNGGGGGGGGGFWVRTLKMSDLPSTVSVTIGAGGAAQTTVNTAGNNGGNSYFGNTVAVTALTVNTPYVIMSIGTTTAANFSTMMGGVLNISYNAVPGNWFIPIAVGTGTATLAPYNAVCQGGGGGGGVGSANLANSGNTGGGGGNFGSGGGSNPISAGIPLSILANSSTPGVTIYDPITYTASTIKSDFDSCNGLPITLNSQGSAMNSSAAGSFLYNSFYGGINITAGGGGGLGKAGTGGPLPPFPTVLGGGGGGGGGSTTATVGGVSTYGGAGGAGATGAANATAGTAPGGGGGGSVTGTSGAGATGRVEVYVI
jgi:hypothetical protein